MQRSNYPPSFSSSPPSSPSILPPHHGPHKTFLLHSHDLSRPRYLTDYLRALLAFTYLRNKPKTVLLVSFLIALFIFLSSFFPDPSPYLLIHQNSSHYNPLLSTSSSFSRNYLDPSTTPHTRIVANSQGFTAFENVYLRHGIWYIVNDNQTGQVPPLHHIQVGHVPAPNQLDLSPQQIANHIKLISPTEAHHFLGPSAGRVDGTTWVWKENFFLAHFGHMAQELLFGSWKISTLAWPRSTPSPDRLIFTLFNQPEWRDKPGLNSYVLRAAFPSLSFLYRQDFEELQKSSLTLSYQRLIFVDRQAAKLAPLNAAANKMVAQLGSRKSQVEMWWEPVRKAVVEAIEASLPAEKEKVIIDHRKTPRITYVSRQEAVQRRLKQADHEALVTELKNLAQRKGAHVEIVVWEHLSAAQQIRLSSRTTIFLSMHGNGLSHQLWAPVIPGLSTTIEMLYPGGWARDFELVASMLGRRHYAFWNDELLWGSEMEPGMVMPDGFHLHSTPVKAKAVIKLLEDILDGKQVPPHRQRL